MRPPARMRERVLPLVCFALVSQTLGWSGCGNSSDKTVTLSEEARKSVIQKKMDLSNRSPSSSRPTKNTLKKQSRPL
jgi:hypothetical protein